MTATGRPDGLGGADREEAGAALVDVRPAADPRLAHEREHDRRVARARRGGGVAHPAAGQLVAERAQQPVGVGGRHDLREMARPLVLLHGFTNTGASWDGVVAALGERYRPLAPDIRGHGTASGAPPGDAAGRDRRRRRRSRPAPSSWPATRWAAGWRCTRRSRSRRGSSGSILIGASPGIADDGRARRPARGRRAAGGRDRERRRSRRSRGAGRRPRCSPISRRTCGRQSTPTACATRRRAWRRPCAAWAPARCRRCGTGSASSTCRSTLIVGERDQKFRATAERMAAALPSARLEIVAGAGHAAHLEAPDGGGRDHRPYHSVSPSPSPGPPGAASCPLAAGSGFARSANRPSVASPHARSGRDHGGGVQRGGDPQRPVQRRGQVDVIAGGAGPARGVDRARDPAAAGDLQADRVGGGRGERVGVIGRLVEGERRRRRRRLTTARGSRPRRRPAPRTARFPTGSSTRSVARASSGDQAPLASIRIAICGPPNARTAASRPASSPIPTLTLTVSKPSARAWAASCAAPERSAAAIVQLTATGGGRVGRRAAARRARGSAARRDPTAPGRSPPAPGRARWPPSSGPARRRSARRRGSRRAPAGSPPARARTSSERHAVVGGQRRRLAVADQAVDRPRRRHQQQLALGDRPVAGGERAPTSPP